MPPDTRPILIGQRTNLRGCEEFRRHFLAGDLAAAAAVGVGQVRAGAAMLDVCLRDPERNEREDMEAFLPRLLARVDAPLLIDTRDPAVMALAASLVPGRVILNSISLAARPRTLEAVAGLVKSQEAEVVVALDDAEGPALTLSAKLAVAERAFRLLDRLGVPRHKLWWDPLVFPCAAPAYLGTASETVRAVARLKQAYPGCRTVLGLSNCSYGLPTGVRRVVDSVFLHACVKVGLDAAIVDPEGLTPYSEIEASKRRLAAELLAPSWKEAQSRRATLQSVVVRLRKI